MSRLFLLLAALVAVLAAPVAAPATAASAPMEHCDDGHGMTPKGGDHDRKAMDHQACCVAVDPGKADDATGIAWTAGVIRQPFIDDAIVSSASGTDPPPPRSLAD